ncbi:type II toxin-antitoxin system YoeB family toxin [Camelimonas sp. ID_303_24]
MEFHASDSAAREIASGFQVTRENLARLSLAGKSLEQAFGRIGQLLIDRGQLTPGQLENTKLVTQAIEAGQTDVPLPADVLQHPGWVQPVQLVYYAGQGQSLCSPVKGHELGDHQPVAAGAAGLPGDAEPDGQDYLRAQLDGTGKPEDLRGDMSGWRSWRIMDAHRMVYRVTGKSEALQLEIAQLRYHY